MRKCKDIRLFYKPTNSRPDEEINNMHHITKRVTYRHELHQH